MKILIGILVLLIALLTIRWVFGTARHYKNAVATALDDQPHDFSALITEEDIQVLPPLLQNYLRITGSVGKPHVRSFKLTMSGQMRMDQSKPFAPVTAEQYTFIESGVRLFSITMNYNGIPISGIHHYNADDALMHIKLLDLVTVVKESGRAMQKAETVTYFNDLCVMCPSALLEEKITWESLNERQLKGTLLKHGHEVSAILDFDDEGRLINFSSDDRLAFNLEGNVENIPWSTPMSKHGMVGDYYLANQGEAIWHYPDSDFAYIQLNIESIAVNPSK